MRRAVSIAVGVVSLFLLTAFYCVMAANKTEPVESGFFLVYGEDVIRPWSRGVDTYFFLPSYFDWSEAELLVSGGTLYVDGEEMLSSPVSEGFEKQGAYSYRFVAEETETGETETGGTLRFLQSANIGAVFLETESGSMENVDADKECREAGKILVQDQEGNISYQGALESVKSRGNATWQTEKKSYGIKLAYKADLLGMGEEKDWILLCNVYDTSKMQNKVCMDMAKAIGLKSSMEGEWVDLYLNGQYHGNYLLCEKVEIGEERVDIADLEAETKEWNGDLKAAESFDTGTKRGILAEYNPEDLTGGYILERDCYYDKASGFITEDGNSFSLNTPEYATAEQVDYIAGYVQEIEDRILAGDEEFWEYIDKDSFVLRYLLDETVMNSDFGITSMYFYKDRNDPRLYAGPVWDYDGSLGVHGFVDFEIIEALEIQKYKREGSLTWYPYLYENPEFYAQAVEKYETVIKPYVQFLIDSGIDSYAETIRPSVEMDQIRWQEEAYDKGYFKEYENNIRFMKYFLKRRLYFLDGEWLGEEKEYAYEGNGERHKVTFAGNERTESFEVWDGECVVATPEYLLEEGQWWKNAWNEVPFYPQIPVYEDVIYESGFM